MMTQANHSVAICTAADAGFFSLLRDLVDSLRQRGKETPHQLCVFDLGLTGEQRGWLESQGAHLVQPGWDVDFPERDKQPGHFRSQIVRAFLPTHFPGFDTYLWLDADVWIQDGAVLTWLVKAAAKNAIALVPELHAAYKKHTDPDECLEKMRLIKQAFGSGDAQAYGLTPSLNSGVFALRADSLHWAIWQRELYSLLNRAPSRFVDQLSLERVIHHHRLAAVYLPARANWVVSQARPAFCADRGKLVDPLPPHDPLWAIHLTLACKDMLINIDFLDGRSISKNLRMSEIGPLVGQFPSES
jgi:hypothetical protein